MLGGEPARTQHRVGCGNRVFLLRNRRRIVGERRVPTVCRKDPALTIRMRTKLIDDARNWLTEKGRWTSSHQLAASRACFEMARTLARYDLDQATAYFAERRAAGLMNPAGPAAPFPYRVAYHLLGFEKAEKLAALRRS